MSGGHLSKEFFELVKSIGESRSKQEEDKIIVSEMAILKSRLNEPQVAPKKMKEYLVRALYVEMLGHDASFAYIKAINLTNDRNLICKKMGYLACNLCLHRDHELMLLLINTIQRDLSSANHLEVCSALTCISRLVNHEMIPAIFPQILKLMSHTNEAVRKKACMALHKLYKLQPDVIQEARDHIRRALCDPDPSVMGSSLHLIHDLAKTNPGSCKDLVPSLVSILKQVTEHRLPRDFDYHRMPAPWLQVKLLSMLATLGHADQKASEQMYELLQEVMRRADSGVNVGYAIIFECVKTITSIYPSHNLLEIAASSISRFISADNHNLKYVGVTGLAAIVQVNPMYAAQHQLVVVDCLEDPDETLKRKTLDLLFKMTNPQNVTVVVEKLLFHLKASSDQHLRRDLVSKITQLAEKYAPSNQWYLDTLTTLFELGGNLIADDTAYNLMRLIAEGPIGDEEQDEAFRRYAVNTYLKILEKATNPPDILMQVIGWVLGEYGVLATVEGYTLEDILDLLCDAIDRTFEDSATRGWILAAITKLVGQNALWHSAGVKEVLQRYRSSQSTDIQQRCYELERLLANPQLMRDVLPYDASCEDVQVDEDLSFLDDFVQKAVGEGAKSYVPPSERKKTVPQALHSPQHATHATLGLNFTPYEAPQKPMRAFQLPGAADASQPAGAAGGSPPLATTLDKPANGRFGPSGGATDQGGAAAKATGLQVSGPRRWGPQGYIGADARQAQPQAAQQDSKAKPPTVAAVVSPTRPFGGPALGAQEAAQPKAAAARELTEKEKTAAALFSGLGLGAGAAPTATSPPPPPSTVPHTQPAHQVPGVGRGALHGQRVVVAEPPAAQPTSAASGGGGADLDVDLLDLSDGFVGPTSASTTSVTGGKEGQPDAAVSGSQQADQMDILSLDVPVAPTLSAGVGVSAAASSPLVPLHWTTQQVGGHWGTLKHEQRVSVGGARGVSSCADLMDKLKHALNICVVEIIGSEGIGAGQLPSLANAPVFLHGKVAAGGQIDLIVRGDDIKMNQRIAEMCRQALQ
ncbi:unnamed protein product [Vitrella brassicaformis CCMP3155]|uniref:AP-4 complex subunit epsilon-1 C-terminal domain-containing protein n=1 Tax=Vitrella brassicaformis (strain CCMP3155) TaxID=1169540 RepID=A0A0G4G478_VITBC|nr:unnamed protein product [Vitrella brassicaformis CCMP3155]|eukprot:CEM22902.1 unnamed protein product [Vitrella brassicaformis CCMP3155]